MANPNIAAVTSIYGSTAYITPAVTTAAQTNWLYATGTSATTAITGLTPASGSVQRVTSIVATNVSVAACAATVSIHSATAGAAIAYPLAYAISVPANSSLIIVDKTSAFYLTEAQSISVQTGVASSLVFVATIETIT